ncbi:MAG: uracil-DNA glycosylase [Chitinophagales bacterium]|nr:uracil-DNA glycosylase [Chitinophagales bacterium]MDW8417880.1 uracil-DNA glycosylase [Chitinophagales bacterium]
MSSAAVQIEESWKQALADEFEQPYFPLIRQFILEQKNKGKKVYPPGPLIFRAFNLTPLPAVKVVILGQDPYHGPGQAHGLCFSVPHGIKPPPSLVNIFKELNSDLGVPVPLHGNLEKWATQGVLLLNAALTVNESEPNSHASCGWHRFTDAVIRKISDTQQGVVFLLWGKFAQEKATLIDTTKHFILTAAHPSPYSADRFFGCRHFSKTNELLVRQGKTPIDWSL